MTRLIPALKYIKVLLFWTLSLSFISYFYDASKWFLYEAFDCNFSVLISSLIVPVELSLFSILSAFFMLSLIFLFFISNSTVNISKRAFSYAFIFFILYSSYRMLFSMTGHNIIFFFYFRLDEDEDAIAREEISYLFFIF